ncbi:MAG: hypothetical protein ACE365_01945 [Gammaproteobacteria bacterium]
MIIRNEQEQDSRPQDATVAQSAKVKTQANKKPCLSYYEDDLFADWYEDEAK